MISNVESAQAGDDIARHPTFRSFFLPGIVVALKVVEFHNLPRMILASCQRKFHSEASAAGCLQFNRHLHSDLLKVLQPNGCLLLCYWFIMKIVFVLHSHKAGGAERHLLQLMQSLSSCGVECIYAGPMDGWLGEQVVALNFRHEHIPYHGFFDLASLISLIRLIRREKADLVHGHLTRGAFYAGWAGRLASVPVIATAHSTNAGKHFGKATRIIAVSDAVSCFLASCGYPHGVLRTVHHGVPDYAARTTNSFDNLRDSFDLDDTPILVMVARFVRDKGHDIALKALASISDRSWTLLLAGATDTNWATEMKLLASRLGIANRVHFIGHRDDVINVYACADMLLAPSRREALSLTLLEAASFSIPVVAADTGGIGEAVANGKTGLLVPSENPDELAKAIRKLLDDPDLRTRMGHAGRQRYEALFSAETMAQSTLSVYQELLEAKVQA